VNGLNHIAGMANSQSALKNFTDNTVLQKLPPKLEESAKRFGALARRRGIKSAQDLITALLIYACSRLSMRALAAAAGVAGIASMTDQAWQKRFAKCVPWLAFLLKETLNPLPAEARKVFSEKPVIMLLDGSLIKQAGKGKRGGGTVRIHMCYNLTEGCMGDILVTDNHTAESTSVLPIKPGAIYIGDAGFGTARNFEHVVSAGADALFRFTPNQMVLSRDEQGKDIVDMAEELKNVKGEIHEFSCYIRTPKRKYIPVRVIASRLPEDKALLAKERKIRCAARKQTKKMRPGTLVYAGWVILITSLDESYTAKKLLEMYRARWQVELLFKRIKQSFKVLELPAASLTHAKAMVHLWLLLWALTEQHALQMEVYLLNKGEDMSRYSPFAVQGFLCEWMKTALNCLWGLSFTPDSHLDELYLRLRDHVSSRCSQYADFHFGAGF